RWVRGNERTLRSLAERPFFKDQFTTEMTAHDPADPEHPKVHRMIREDHFLPILEEEGGFIELFILRASDGLILISTDEKQEEKYRESEPYFVEGKNRTYVGNVVYSLALGKAAMTIATPIRDRDGNLIAVLAGHADLAEMSDIMEQSSGLSGSEETYLVNAFNFFVTEPGFGQGYALKKALYTEGVQACLDAQARNSFDQAQDRDAIGFYEDYRGVPVIGAYRWLPERELCILTEVDQAEAYAPIVALRNTVLGIGVSVALVAALLGVFFARTITGPLDQLVQGAEEIGRGNLEYRIEVASRDEIGQLATAFNEMAAKRKQARQAQRESEQWLSTTLRSIGDAVIATDAQGLVTLMNPVSEDLTGCDEAETVGQPLEDVLNIINEQTGERAENPVARVLREGVVVGLANHTVLIAKDGTKRPIADSGAPIRDKEGNIIGTVMVFRDITERKLAEEELRESEAKYRNLTESLDELIYRADPDTFAATYVNPAVEVIYGYTVEEWLGDPTLWESTLHPDDKERVFAAFTKARKNLESDAMEYRILRKDKTVRWVQDRAGWEKDQQGNVVSMNGVIYDITERKEMRERLLRQEKLAVLGQLAGGVGHELRNPLGAIKNAAYFLNMALEDPEPMVKEALDILDSEVGTSEGIIRSLLDYARPRPVVPRKVDLTEVIGEVLERFGVPENVAVEMISDQDLPIIYADPDQLSQVFDNLIRNAVQAMPEGGRLLVEAAGTDGGESAGRPEWVTISVTDTGVGIPEENLAKMFEPLFTTKAQGIGLGLAVTKMLVEGHGGTIRLASAAGEGSTFTVKLPVGI
ncbi:MAG: PAS domain S-box protein, partial [Anaerolineae bacterium]|nr:PAS domain S-box protein [Anaerolineae bacterium]